jgi:DNA primase
MIPEDKIAELRDRADIVAIIGEVVPLKRAGTNWKGLCPFHQEKSPSFNVNPGRQIFHCFGCHVGGDVIAFVMKLEGLSFLEAVRSLAAKAGVELPSTTESPQAKADADREARRREKLLEINELACRFFEKSLEGEAGAVAREAIAKRGITERVWKAFRLGYAPDAWGALAEHLRAAGVSPAEAEVLGLVAPRRSGPGHYDKFRHRLMFPVRGPAGRVIAFSGRILPGGVTTGGRAQADSDPPRGGLRQSEQGGGGGAEAEGRTAPPRDTGGEPPKYVNSSESPVYHKGDTLYGLHEARVALRRAERAILVEGNFDLLALVERGFENVVAPMGTAFTPSQAKILSRAVHELVLLFDGDAAGQKAAAAAFEIIRGAGLVARVAVLPSGMDPDDLLRAKGPEALREILVNARGLSEYLIDQAAARCGDGHEAQARAVHDLRPVLEAETDPIGRQKLIDRIAVAFHLMPHDARRLLSGKPPVSARPAGRGQGAAWPPAQLALLGAAIDGAAELEPDLAARVREALADAVLGQAFDALMLSLRPPVGPGEAQRLDGPAFLEHLEDEPALAKWVGARVVSPEIEADKVRAYLAEAVQRLPAARQREKNKNITEQIRRAQAAGDDAQVEELLRAKMSLA